jgi:Flp pilus assembly pilin Flp
VTIDTKFDVRPSYLTFRRREAGVTAIEYALIAVLLSVVAVGAVSLTGENVLGLYDYVAEEVKKVTCRAVGCP